MQIQQIKLRDIFPYSNNPRKNARAVETVSSSIEQYGFQQPIVVDKSMTIIAGHTRYLAAKKLGLATVPVVIAAELSDEQCRAYRIMDNRSNENSSWDDDLLFKELEILLSESTLQDLSYETGFTESELNKLFKTPEDPLEKYYKSESYRSQRGELYLLGDHKLVCGDSTSANDLKLLMTNEKIDLIWEDPPYGVAYETANGINYTKEENELRNHKIVNDNLTEEQLNLFLNQHLEVLKPYGKKGTPIYWCHDIRFTQQFRDILVYHGFHISDTLIWKKNKHSNWLSNYAKYYEPILYGWIKGAEHPWYGKGMMPNAIDLDQLTEMSKEELIDLIKSLPSNYQEVDKESRTIASLHPTVKPVKLIIHHILNSSRQGDIVYDGFAGSGSTLIACERTNRQARCIEYEPKFVDIIIQRWQDLTGLKAQRSDGILWDDIMPTTLPDIITDNLETVFDMEKTI